MGARGTTLEFVDAVERSDLAQKEIGRQIRAQRRRLGWSQRELADKVHTSQNHIYLLENGKTDATVATLHKLANALEMTIKIEPVAA